MFTVQKSSQAVHALAIQAETLHYPKWNHVMDTILGISKYLKEIFFSNIFVKNWLFHQKEKANS